MKDTKEKLSPLSVVLHWSVGVTIIAMLSIGTVMDEFEIYALYPIHKSIGILIFAVVLWRVLWRTVNGWPAPAADYPRWQQIAARTSHWILLTGTVLMPLSGMVMSAVGGRGLAVFGFELLAVNRVGDEIVAYNEPLAHFAHSTHHWVGSILIATVAVHVAAALKHHFFNRDRVLRRMLAR